MVANLVNLGYNGGGYVDAGSYSSSYSSGARTRSFSSSYMNTLKNDLASTYSADIAVIQKYLEQGKIDKAVKAYEAMMEEAGETAKLFADSRNSEINNSQIESAVQGAFQKAVGISLLDSVDENTSNPFGSGLAQGLPVIGLFCKDTTTAEAMAKLDGEKTSFADKFKEYAGAFTSGAAVGAGIGTAVPVVGTIVGAVAGGVLGIVQTALKDIF